MNTDKLLVAIANYGEGNQHYLYDVVEAYRSMPIDMSIVVLSNIHKDLGSDVEVVVGLPSSNPWSLPFAHRKLFLDRLKDYDFFVYSEDDTLLSWPALKAFINSTEVLDDDEIAGFVRTEESSTGDIYYSSCHSFFRWIPSSVRERGGQLWARYSNEHSACYVASRGQLERAINSGGFPLEPHEGRHDMLCTAATDIYTQCGFQRLLCIDRISEFVLPHLPNKYIGKMGLPAEELGWQIDALKKVHSGELPGYELINPETLLPGGMGSKFYREQPDYFITNLLGPDQNKVLVWGAGDGVFEDDLQKQGYEISVIPLDAVVGESCRRRGLKVLPHDDLSLEGESCFDYVILRDILHLVDEPGVLLTDLKRMLKPGGSFIARVPNLNDARILKLRWNNPRFKGAWNKNRIGATPFNGKMLKGVAKNAGLGEVKTYTDVPESRNRFNRLSLGLLDNHLSPYLYLTAKM